MTEPVLSWHVQAQSVGDAVLSTLRLSAGSDPDESRVRAKVLPAMRMIDAYLDLRAVAGRVQYPGPGQTSVVTYASDDAPADVLEAAVQVAVELYRRKDAPFGVLDGFGADGGSVRIGRDSLAGVETQLAPWREGWGIA